jgi:hypothetical protein
MNKEEKLNDICNQLRNIRFNGNGNTEDMAKAIENNDKTEIEKMIQRITGDPYMNIESSKGGGLKETPRVIVNYLRNAIKFLI